MKMYQHRIKPPSLDSDLSIFMAAGWIEDPLKEAVTKEQLQKYAQDWSSKALCEAHIRLISLGMKKVEMNAHKADAQGRAWALHCNYIQAPKTTK